MSFRIEHRLGVPATASEIWEVLSDFPGWAQWNPVHPQIEGQLKIGSQLVVHEAFEGLPPKVIQPTVVDWVPDSQILWRVTEMSGFVRRLRYIEIDTFEETPNGSILANGEIWSGMIGERIAKRQRRSLRTGFEAFNAAAAKHIAERLGRKLIP